jgi:hypothetical protein
VVDDVDFADDAVVVAAAVVVVVEIKDVADVVRADGVTYRKDQVGVGEDGA